MDFIHEIVIVIAILSLRVPDQAGSDFGVFEPIGFQFLDQFFLLPFCGHVKTRDFFRGFPSDRKPHGPGPEVGLDLPLRKTFGLRRVHSDFRSIDGVADEMSGGADTNGNGHGGKK